MQNTSRIIIKKFNPPTLCLFSFFFGVFSGQHEEGEGLYAVTEDNLPLNPVGRTGVSGRGVLKRYGPNHAAEPIVTRWRRKGKTVLKDSYDHSILEYLLVKRTADGAWAIPGYGALP